MQINSLFLQDRIHIFREWKTKTDTGWVNWCTQIHADIPASLWCAEWKVDIFACLPKKRIGREICAEIRPDIVLDCFDKDIIIEVFRNECNIWRYRIYDVIPNKLLATGALYSYHLIWMQING